MSLRVYKIRYADRAKQIKNKAVVNESPTDKLIRMLKEENDNLKKQLESGLSGGGIMEVKVGMTAEEIEMMRRQLEEEIRAQLEMNMATIEDRKKWTDAAHTLVQVKEKTQAELEDEKKREKIRTVPHFVNLNEDAML